MYCRAKPSLAGLHDGSPPRSGRARLVRAGSTGKATFHRGTSSSGSRRIRPTERVGPGFR